MAVATKNIKTVGKLVSVLECFSTSDRALSAVEIARRIGLPRSTAHRSILALKEIGFLEQDQSRDKYRLGLKLFQLGITMLHNMDLQREARPFVEALNSLTGESIHLCVFDGERMVRVESARGGSTGPHNATITMELSPCYCTGVGKATLAFQPDMTVEKVINSGLTAFTPNTIVDAAELRRELARIRQQGHAFDRGEHVVNVRCVAAPIRNIAARVIGAISVSGPADRMSDERLEKLVPYVMSHAEAISRRLGFVRDKDMPQPAAPADDDLPPVTTGQPI
jgi:DNA-binding IclR family transcriptional regulator